ncbi:MAG: hypothetical protein LBT02_01990 [Rickettsiales bacterium]|jgi:DNA ligase (NAD+)|nr:hypothetical protein [Rickettsiales bacterium]
MLDNKIIPLRYSDGWGNKSVNNLFDAINKARNIPLERFLFAMGIRYLGEVNAKIIAKNYVSLDNFLTQIQNAHNRQSDEYATFIGIDGIGEKIGNSIIESFYDKKKDGDTSKSTENSIIDMMNELKKYVNIIDYTSKTTGKKLEGKNVLFTGTLTMMTRTEAKARAEEHGAKVVSTISNKTDFLIAGDDAGSKLKKAEEMEIKILSEKEWLEIIK